MSQYRRRNEEAGCGTLMLTLLLIFFGPAILEFVLFLLFMAVAFIFSLLSSIGHAFSSRF